MRTRDPQAAPDPASRRRALRISRLLDAVFVVGVLGKGINGLVELIAAVPLLLIPAGQLSAFARQLTATELAQEPNDLLANLVVNGAASLDAAGTTFLGWYFLIHGLVKLAIVVAILVGARRVYPWAIGALSALTIYQIVELFLQPTVGLVLLTVLDLVIIALTWREWREHRDFHDVLRSLRSALRRRRRTVAAG